MCGMVTSRLVVNRVCQNPSSRVTDVSGTAVIVDSTTGCAAAIATTPTIRRIRTSSPQPASRSRQLAAQLREQLLEIPRQRRLDLYHVATERMRKRQSPGVQ